MIAIFARKREIRAREAMLRGVYEENLRIIGKGRRSPLAKRVFPTKLVLTLVISAAAILLHDNLFIKPFSGGDAVTAGIIRQQPTVMRAEEPAVNSANTADLRAVAGLSGVPLSRMFGLGVKTIMIDPGHGGTDVGTSGKLGTREKDVTLDIAKRLRDLLRKSGEYNVLMTREDDETVPLHRRVEMAQEAKADIFISIHLNYLPNKPINIVETYYFGPSSDGKTLRLAETENAGSQYGLSEFKEVVERLGRRMKLQESREFASSIQNNLFVNMKREGGNAHDFGVKRAPFVVLLGVDVPAVLAEVSCLSNVEEEQELNTASHRAHIARYLEAGILDYLHKGDAKHEAAERTASR